MKKSVLIIMLLLSIRVLTFSQIVDVDYATGEEDEALKETKDEDIFFARGFMDYFTNGKVQGTAQVIKLFLGEPKGTKLPVYVFAGASGGGFGESELNEVTASNLLNPIGGLFNVSLSGTTNLYKSETEITSFKLAYHLSGRLINGEDSLGVEGANFFSTYANAGLYYQTGAWEGGTDPSKAGNLGVFWIQARATISQFLVGREPLEKVFSSSLEDSILWGYSIDLGLEIDQKINLKAGLYHYLNNQNISFFDKPVFKFSLDYNI